MECLSRNSQAALFPTWLWLQKLFHVICLCTLSRLAGYFLAYLPAFLNCQMLRKFLYYKSQNKPAVVGKSCRICKSWGIVP